MTEEKNAVPPQGSLQHAALDMWKILDELEDSFDQEIYPEQVKEDCDALPDREYSVTITAKQWRAIGRALAKVDSHKRELERKAVSSLQLVVCTPNRVRQVDSDYWTDDLPEDGDLPGWLEDALKALNKVIAAHKDDPLSWSAGGQRVTLKDAT